MDFSIVYQGRPARVDAYNRLDCHAVTEPFESASSFSGRYYNINTGAINLTSGSQSAVFYIKNTGTSNIVVTNLFYLLGNSTGGSGDVEISVLRNPTAGDISSSGTAISAVNRNCASQNTMTASIYKGAEGLTSTGGSEVLYTLNTGNGRIAITGADIIIGPNNILSVLITPQSGNTSQNVAIAMSAYTDELRD